MVELHEVLTARQRAWVNATGQALLVFARASDPTNGILAGVAIQAICRTFASSPKENLELLRSVVEESNLAERGYIELPWLVREIDFLIGSDPNLVEHIFSRSFSYEEESQAVTSRGSRLFSLVSHRAQDYRQALWSLADAFPRFLLASPVSAIRAGLSTIESYNAKRTVNLRHETEPTQTLNYRGKVTRYMRDFSAIWDSGSTHEHDEPVRILSTIVDYLRDLSTRDKREALEDCLNAIADSAKSAVTWRRLLDEAAEQGGLLRDAVWELCLSTSVLLGLDTRDAVGRYLSARYRELSESQKEAIEAAILALPKQSSTEQDEVVAETRALLLGCLPEAELVHHESLELLAALRAGSGIPANKRPFEISGFRSIPTTQEDWLARKGVQIDASPNRFLLDLIAPVRDFTFPISLAVSGRSVADLISKLHALHAGLKSEIASGAHESTRSAAWGYLAQACDRAARASNLSSNVGEGKVLADLLLEAATESSPEFDESTEMQFLKTPSWGSPAARIDATSGLLRLSQRDSLPRPAVLEAISKLSRDPVSAVRFQVATYITCLFSGSPEFVWTTVAQMAEEDRSQTVLHSLIVNSLSSLASLDADRTIPLVLGIVERFEEIWPRHECRKAAAALLTQYYLCCNNDVARGFVLNAVEKVGVAPLDACDLLMPSREFLTFGSGPQHLPIRRRAIDLLTRLAQMSTQSLRVIETKYGDGFGEDLPSRLRETVEAIAEVSIDIATQVYFASGAADAEDSASSKGSGVLEMRKRFYVEASELLDALVAIGLVPSAQHLMETFERLIDIDPPGVFRRIVATVDSSAKNGYANESLAADLVVRIVKRYLADYRGLFKDDSDCRAGLLKLLDVFVVAGWTSAASLTYKLEDLFR